MSRRRGIEAHTLGLLEGTLLNAGLQGLVEERVEHLLANVDGVVGAHILLEGLAADDRVSNVKSEGRCGMECGK
jgi:hypothetical protein